FNSIITSLKALDEGFSSKNYVRKLLRALHPKWRTKVTAIEELKDLTLLSLDELIGNLKVYEVIIKNPKWSKAKENKVDLSLERLKINLVMKKVLPLIAKTKKSRSKEVKMTKMVKVKENVLDALIGECPKSPRSKNKRDFIGGTWSDSGEDEEEKTKDETCFVAQVSNEVLSKTEFYRDNLSSINDS
ncbi:hypothetical protein Tco_0813220, partial [Tanacetum coccineum]